MKDITITIRPKLGYGIAIAVIVLTLGFSIGGQSCRASILYFTTAVGASGALLAAYFAGRALNRSIEATENSNDMQKIRLAYEMVQALSDASSVEVRDELQKDIDNPDYSDCADEKQYDRISQDPKLKVKLLQVLGIFEDISIAIRRGIVDEQFLKDSLRSMVLLYYHGFEGYIKGLRRKTSNPRYYLELENLKNEWNKTTT